MNFIFLLFFSFLVCNQDTILQHEKLPPIDFRKGGIIYKRDLKLEDFLNKNKTKKYLSFEQIEEIKNYAKEFNVDPVSKDEIIILETSHGTMKFKLFPELSPLNCNNFKKIANSGFYDQTLFHELIPGFILKGGDVLTRDAEDNNDGTGNPGWTVDAEFNNLKHKRGTLSMHRIKNDVNSAGSQFFITLSKQKKLDDNYTIIGEVIEGESVLEAISNIPSESKLTFRLLKTKIPKSEDVKQWDQIEIKEKIYFLKIPQNVDKDFYKKMILDRLNNKKKPSVPIKIKKLRVTNNKLLND